MPESRAGLSAQTYLLPQPQQMQPVQQEQPFNDGVQALEGLQFVRNQTSDYYKKVSALKSFMQSANKNLGIDVRVPDMSRPESIELNQIYQTAMADILAQGNELKQGAAINNMHINRGDQFTDSYYGKSAAQAQQGRDVYSGLEKIVTESNDAVTTPSYNDAELKAKQEKYDQTKAYYEAIKEKDPSKTQYADAQIAGLAKPAPRVYRPSSYTATDRKYGRQVAAGGNWLKKTTNLLSGAHDSYTPDPNRLNANGSPFLVSTEFAQTRFGDGVIKEWRFDPDTNELGLVVTTKDGNKVIDVTGQDPQVLATTLSKLPSEVIVDAAEKLDAYDDYQQIDRGKLLGKDYEKLIEKNKGKSKGLGTEVMVQALDNDLKALPPKTGLVGMFQDDERLQIGNFRIVRRKDKYEIENIQEALPVGGKSAKDVLRNNKFFEATDAGRKQLIDFLTKQGAHVDYHKSKYNQPKPAIGTEVAPTTKAPTTFDPAAY